MKTLIVFTLVFLAFAGCGPKIYQANTFEQTRQSHRLLAIIPFDVEIESKKLPKGVTPEMIHEEERDFGYGMQSDVHGFFLQQISKDHYTVNFQDVSKTNAILKEAGLTYNEIHSIPKEKVCQLLGVDAVVSGTATLSQPISEGAAVALGLLVGMWGPTNTIKTTITIHEAKAGELMWKYDYEAAGNVLRSRQSVSNALMKNASKKFPYMKSKPANA